MFRAFALSLLLLLVAGCAGQRPRDVGRADDATNPAAVEAPYSAPSPMALEPAPGQEGSAQHMQMPAMPHMETSPSTRASAQVIYTCTMHPKIAVDHPGNCPICGMKLVPREGHK